MAAINWDLLWLVRESLYQPKAAGFPGLYLITRIFSACLTMFVLTHSCPQDLLNFSKSEKLRSFISVCHNFEGAVISQNFCFLRSAGFIFEVFVGLIGANVLIVF